MESIVKVANSYFTRKKGIRLVIITSILGLITFIHYIIGASAPGLLHSILGHLYIIPILLGAYWYGIKGGISVSIASTILFSPHLFLHWADPFIDIYNFVEIFLFLILGGVTGVLSQMERNQRARYEDALMRLDESHKKLKEQTDILFKAEEQLKRAERLSALGELSASMAHEIRNPLGAIKGAAEILKDTYTEGDARFEFVQILLKETDRLNHILQEFLDFARSKQAELKKVSLSETIESVLVLISQQAKKSGIRLEKRFYEGDLTVYADKDLLKQAFLNLVLNAIQSMPEGGTLTIETALDGLEVVAKVSDTGIGMDDEIRKKLFTPFFTTKKNGTGLGLAIVYRIIQGHGGKVDVDTAPGRGSTFILRLPVYSDQT